MSERASASASEGERVGERASARGLVIAIVGAESTGKSTLAVELAARLAHETGLECTAVGEFLREWCDREGRTPHRDEQSAIAAEQAARIQAAAHTHAVVVADTTPLMTAVYSLLLFQDSSLVDSAMQVQRACDATLLTALDLPWVPDGHQRDGAHVRAPVDTALRELMAAHRIGWSVVGGSGAARLDAALDAVTPLLLRKLADPAQTSPASPAPRPGLFTRLQQRQAAQPQWNWVCETCDSSECEHASLRASRGN